MIKLSGLVRLVSFLAIVGAGYWYWSGPYQEKINPSYETVLKRNDENMAECIRAAAYQFGATGSGSGPEVATRKCAEKFDVYKSDGRWHSHDAIRPD